MSDTITITRRTAEVLLSFEDDVRIHPGLWHEYLPVFDDLRAALSPPKPPPDCGCGMGDACERYDAPSVD